MPTARLAAQRRRRSPVEMKILCIFTHTVTVIICGRHGARITLDSLRDWMVRLDVSARCERLCDIGGVVVVCWTLKLVERQGARRPIRN